LSSRSIFIFSIPVQPLFHFAGILGHNMKNPSYLLVRYCFLLICAFTYQRVGTQRKRRAGLPVRNIRIDGEPCRLARHHTISDCPHTFRRKAAIQQRLFRVFYDWLITWETTHYTGIEVTDDDYKSDTSKSVSWNSQDALAIYLMWRITPHVPLNRAATHY